MSKHRQRVRRELVRASDHTLLVPNDIVDRRGLLYLSQVLERSNRARPTFEEHVCHLRWPAESRDPVWGSTSFREALQAPKDGALLPNAVRAIGRFQVRCELLQGSRAVLSQPVDEFVPQSREPGIRLPDDEAPLLANRKVVRSCFDQFDHAREEVGFGVGQQCVRRHLLELLTLPVHRKVEQSTDRLSDAPLVEPRARGCFLFGPHFGSETLPASQDGQG